MNEEERSFQSNCDRAVEAGFVPLLDRSVVYGPGVDEQNIETTKGVVNGLRNRRLTRDIAGVSADHEHVAAKFGARRLDSRRIYTGDRDAGPLSEKLTGRFQADAARPASN